MKSYTSFSSIDLYRIFYIFLNEYQLLQIRFTLHFYFKLHINEDKLKVCSLYFKLRVYVDNCKTAMKSVNLKFKL